MIELMNSYESTIGKIRGWLHPTTAYLTMFLLNEQIKSNIRGNMLEIGVLGGRYIALMSNFLSEGEKAFGLDPFYQDGTDIVQVIHSLKMVNCDHNVKIIETRSDNYTKEEYMDNWGPLRFFHVDGSHQCEDVIKDLAIVDSVLENNGLVAFDDFFNPYWIGVTEALFRYFEITPKTDLVPVGYCRNKLFLSRTSHQKYYQTLFQCFITEHHDRLSITGAPDRTSKILSQVIPVLY